MFSFDARRDGWQRLDESFVSVLNGARFDNRFRFIDAPFAVCCDKAHLDHAERFAPEVCHYRGRAVDEALDLVDTRQVELRHRARGVRKQLMRMTDQHSVDARHRRQMPVRVFHRRCVRSGIEPAVRNRDDQVRAFGAHFRHVLFSEFLDAVRVHYAVQPALVPVENFGRCECNHADLDRCGGWFAISANRLDRAVKNDVRFEQWLPVSYRQYIGQHQWKVRTSARYGGYRLFSRSKVHVEPISSDLRQKTQAVIELVIADAAGVVFQLVHHLVHRQYLIASKRIDLRLIVGKCCALNGVAVVKQERVGELFAGIGDECSHTFKADGLVLAEAEVVIAQHVGVQVGCLEQRDLGPRAVGNRSAALSRRAARAKQNDGCDQREREKSFHDVFLCKLPKNKAALLARLYYRRPPDVSRNDIATLI